MKATPVQNPVRKPRAKTGDWNFFSASCAAINALPLRVGSPLQLHGIYPPTLQFSAVPKFYGTRPPPLIQSCYNIDIESSRYSGGDNKKQLVKISDIVLKHWLKNFDDSSSSKINSDKNPSTEITKPLSACNGWFQINRREIRFGLGFSWLGFGFQSLRAKVSSACAFT